MDISSFDDLLQAARMQPEPQRLLFVFAAVELPDDATPAQRARFEAGQGGALVPLMCVDKTPQELASFDVLVAEARQFTASGHDTGHDTGFRPGACTCICCSATASARLQRPRRGL